MQGQGRGVFINYRRDDTGWAANALFEALRLRPAAAPVFQDNSSFRLGVEFAEVTVAAVRSSAVLVALIGPGWDLPPFLERLHDEQDWVRKEILLAEQHGVTLVPVLVDRNALPAADDLPEPLRFLPGRQAARVRQAVPRDVDMLADDLAELAGTAGPTGSGEPGLNGVERTRPAVERLVRRLLPPVQQWSGNRDRLIDLVLAALRPSDRLVFMAPARLPDRPAGSATVLVTELELVVVDVHESFQISDDFRLPLAGFGRVEVTPTYPLFADVTAHTTGGATVRILGLFRDQARQLADHIRAGATAGR